jgi:sialate O-acetylesterase
LFKIWEGIVLGLKIPAVFSDNMMLQRESEVCIWGQAEENTVVKGEICGKISESIVKNGSFKLKFNDLKAGGPFDMKISSKDESITLKNILIGDVWVAGGQSNMEFRLKDSINGDKYIEESDYPEIRYYEVPEIEYEDGEIRIPNLEDKGWQVSSKECSEKFSAVAYHFAKNLNEDLNIPIGIIDCNKGGTSASCWMSKGYLAKDENIKSAYLDNYEKKIENLSQEEEDRLTREFYKAQEEYNKKEEEYKKKYPEKSLEELHKEIGQIPWPPPLGRKSYLRPFGLYKTMLSKITPFRIKGVIWYQGEEDSSKPECYKTLFGRLIQNWRDDFENPDLPFVFVQLPMFNDEKIDTWQIIRDSQLYTLKNVKNTSMIVTIDCGEKEDVHPKDKKPVGERLALVVREDVYKEDVKGHSPIYSGYEVQADKILVSFEYVQDGELVIKDGDVLKGFQICGITGEYYDAKAEIVGSMVQVYSENVKNPKAVRYGWKNYVEINLFNKQGLPASPFNTESKY